MDTTTIEETGPLPRLNKRATDYGKSIDDATPDEWDRAARKHITMVLKPPPVEHDQSVRDRAPLAVQVGGEHYKKHSIQPIQFIHANDIPFIEGNVIKYVSRWRDKGGMGDLEKAKHYLEILIALEKSKAGNQQIRN